MELPTHDIKDVFETDWAPLRAIFYTEASRGRKWNRSLFEQQFLFLAALTSW